MRLLPLLCLMVFIPCVFCRTKDWLINDITTPSDWLKNEDGSYTLTNGLISRTFSTSPGFTTIDYYSHEKSTSLLRALSPEAVLKLDDVMYNIGHVITKMSRGYLNRTELSETIGHDPASFQYAGHRTHPIEVDFPYTPLRGAPPNIHWPPKGVRVDVIFKAPQSAPTTHQGITVTIHYQIYDGIPAMSKWVSVQADQKVWDQVTCTLVSIELLAVNQPFSKISTWDGYTFKPDGADNAYDWLYIDLNRPYGGLVTWLQDPAQAQVAGSFQPLLNVSNSVPVPVVSVGKDGYTSFKVNELIHCSEDPTRKSLSKNRLLKLLAPHVQENPIFFHMTDSRSEQFRATVDQLAEVGFEMIIYSFGSGLYMEEENETYLEGIRKDVAYANSKGIEVGGYDLIVLDRGDLPKEMRATDAQGNPGGNACLASEWYETIYGKLMNFMTKTNMTMVETDGPYGGGSCHSTTHAHHKGYGDSVYKQNMLQERMYNEFRRRSFYINSPDTYYYGGSNRNGLGYNENQYSLPRWMDLGISRQTVFDRVYSVPPTAGWMFVPLQDYHSGGEAAAFEPLQQHLAELNFAFAQYLGAGVAACYRGNRIYDSDATKELVQHWVSFYKKYRALVTSDIIRITRPDMQNIDAFMHVNWRNEDDKALVMVFNPSAEKRNVTLGVPVYYTGIRNKALVSEQEAGYVLYDIGFGPQGIEIEIEVELEARSTTWFKIKPTTPRNAFFTSADEINNDKI